MRKIIAMFLLLTWITFYIWAVATSAGATTDWPRIWQLVFYVVAGVLWILPLKPLFAWMNTGVNMGPD